MSRELPLEGHLPADHVVFPGGPLAFRHPGWRRRRFGVLREVVPAAMKGATATLVGETLLWMAAKQNGIPFDGTLVLTIMLAVIIPCWIYVQVMAAAVDTWAKAHSAFNGAAYRIANDLKPNNLVLMSQFEALRSDHRAEVRDLRNATTLRIAEIARLHGEASSSVGINETPTVNAARDEAALRVIRTAVADHQRIRDDLAQAARRREVLALGELETALASIKTFGTSSVIAKGAAPLGNAVVTRLAANAEAALAIDPDLVDSAGARIDALVRQHLPRLLQRHADLALHARIGDLAAADRDLEEGVELVRTSIEEAISGLNHERADALRSEVHFLRMRRAATTLTPIGHAA